MSWAVGYDAKWQRDIGYGVPARCEDPECDTSIHRGLDYVCGGDPHGGEHGCGLFFCSAHLAYSYTSDGMDDLRDEDGELYPRRCQRCVAGMPPFELKPDVQEWIQHKLTDPSWQPWRDENADWVAQHALAQK